MTVYGRVLVKCQDFAFTGGRPWPTHVSRIKRFEQLAGSFTLAPVPELAVLANSRESDSPDDESQTSSSDDSNSTEDDSATTVYSSVSSDAAASMSDSSSWWFCPSNGNNFSWPSSPTMRPTTPSSCSQSSFQHLPFELE